MKSMRDLAWRQGPVPLADPRSWSAPRRPDRAMSAAVSGLVLPYAQAGTRRTGRAPGPHPGPSGSLTMVSPWAEGDDSRLIHWAATARTGQLHVRRLEQPRSPSVLVVVDDGAGMALGSAVPKWALAVDAALLLAQAARRDGARFQARCWSGCCKADPDLLVPSWREPPLPLPLALEPRDLLVVVTSFTDPAKALSLLDAGAWGSAMLVEVRDPGEERLPAGMGWLAAPDGSTAVLVNGDDPDARRAFEEALRVARCQSAGELARRSVLHAVVSCDGGVLTGLERVLGRAARSVR